MKRNSNDSKHAHFDEDNIKKTYHPPDKDYGFMKVDEPKTPFERAEPDDGSPVDPNALAARLKALERNDDGESDDDDELERQRKLERKIEFEKRRKQHYNMRAELKTREKLCDEDEESDVSN